MAKHRQVIYNQDQLSTSIYLVIDGKVQVCRMADDGHQSAIWLCHKPPAGIWRFRLRSSLRSQHNSKWPRW